MSFRFVFRGSGDDEEHLRHLPEHVTLSLITYLTAVDVGRLDAACTSTTLRPNWLAMLRYSRTPFDRCTFAMEKLLPFAKESKSADEGGAEDSATSVHSNDTRLSGHAVRSI